MKKAKPKNETKLFFIIGAILTLLLLNPTYVHADESTTAQTPPQGRFIAHFNLGVVAYNWMGTSGAAPSTTITLADRQSILQLVGVGYFLRPSLRLMTSFQFVERLSGGPANTPTFTLGSVIPWIGWHPFTAYRPFFVGVGPCLAYRNYGKYQFDAGIWTSVGAGVPLGKGFSLGGAVQFPVMLKIRTTFTIAPSVFTSYRF